MRAFVQPKGFPRPFLLSTPSGQRAEDHEESEERLRLIETEIASLPWSLRRQLIWSLRERDDLR